MQLSSDQKAAIDRGMRQYNLETGGSFAQDILQEELLDAVENGSLGITADAKDIDSLALGGGAFTWDEDGSAGLDFAYDAGRFHNGKTRVSVSAGTVSLSASNTNYVEVDRSGTVSANTTAFTSGRLPLYVVVTGVATISTVTSAKPLMTLIGDDGVDGSMLSVAAQTKEVHVTVGTIATSAGSTVFCAIVPNTVAAGSKLTKVSFVTKDALAADDTNSVKFGLGNKQTGAGTQTLVDITAAANSTKVTGGSALVAYTKRDLTLVTLTGGTERDVTGGHVLELTFTVVGTLGGELTQCVAILEFTFEN